MSTKELRSDLPSSGKAIIYPVNILGSVAKMECHPVRNGRDGISIGCPPDDADFWSAYVTYDPCDAVLAEQPDGMDCIADFSSEQECCDFIALLEGIVRHS